MSHTFPDFCTSLIGSMPRSPELLQLKAEMADDPTKVDSYHERLRSETQEVLAMQKRAGIDVPVSGELDRDNFVSYVAERVDGIRLMAMDEILAITTDSDSFKESLQQMDASDNSMSNPICVGKIDTEADLNGDEVQLMRELGATENPAGYKMTIPSPYILTRSMWLKEVSKAGYANRKELGKDVVQLLKNEIHRLVKSGASVIQVDEPIISEVVFTREGDDSSFY